MAFISTFDFFRKLLAPRYWFTWLGLGLLWLLARLPYRLLLSIGRLLGYGLQRMFAKHRRVIQRNLELCFPHLDAQQREQLVKANCRELGFLPIQFALAWFGSARAISKIPIHIAGLEHLTSALSTNHGVLLVGAHFSHLELAGRLLTQSVALAGMYRQHPNEVFEWALRRARSRYTQAMFSRDQLRPMLKYLKVGGIVWYAPDHGIKGKDSVFVPFFGLQAETITATHHLARLSGALVIPFFHKREKNGSYSLRLEAPLAMFPSNDVLKDTAHINALIERMVCEAPDQYLWKYKRFKSRPLGESSLY